MSKFSYFVVFAEMRTGSNFLETNLNAIRGVSCHGEAFNPHFLGYPKTKEILGVSQEQRDRDPFSLLQKFQDSEKGLHGFRYFHNHDPRILDQCLKDRKCAKIILTRNPLDSYISWKIAQETGQWKLTDAKARKASTVEFDEAQFQEHLENTQNFQIKLLNNLQKTGQTAFYLSYEDLQELDVMNGLARFLGTDERLEGLENTLKKQNPSGLSEKVTNFEQMQQSLASFDRFNLTRTPNFEPRRGPSVTNYVASQTSGLLYLPIQGSAQSRVLDWMKDVDSGKVISQMSQKDLRQWKRKNVGHQSFTVIRHPVARAHHVFCEYILKTKHDKYQGVRKTLRRRYALAIPEVYPDPEYDLAAHKNGFIQFLTFLKANLDGQTAIRIDAAWASLSQCVNGFGEFALPDHIIREENLALELPHILKLAKPDLQAPDLPEEEAQEPFELSQVYDAQIEALARKTYQRDYMMFGFGDWRSE